MKEQNHYFLAGVAMMIENDGRFLLGKRAADKDFGPDLWEFPSGRMQNSESVEQAIIREGKEELGVDVKLVQIIDSYTFDRKGVPLILINCYCKIKQEPESGDEHSMLGWFTYDETIDLLSFEAQRNSLNKLVSFLKLVRHEL